VMKTSKTERAVISTVVITYNHRSFISECLESILNQRGNFKLQLIVCNDNSTDGTDKIIKSILSKYENSDHDLIYVARDKNIGMGNNFVDALSRITGDYVAFCEGDDFWYTDTKLQDQLNILNKGYAVCFHDAYLVNEKSDKIAQFSNERDVIRKRLSGEIELQRLISSPLRAWHISSVLAIKSAIPKNVEWLAKHPIYDFGFLALVFSYGRIYYDSVPRCAYRKHNASVTSSRGHDWSYFKKMHNMLGELESKLASCFSHSVQGKKISNFYFLINNCANRNTIIQLLLFPFLLILNRWSPYSIRDEFYRLRRAISNDSL
jgi:glycosyltransferase involved in cell wall biosynthesis